MVLTKISKKITTFALEVASFPAVKLGKASFRNILWKFTDEITLVSVCAIVLILGNLALGSSYFDNSPLARLLLSYPEKNQALYYRILSSTAEVSSPNFITSVSAEELTIPPVTPKPSTSSLPVTYIDEQGLHAPIPDTLRPLLNAQILVYETKVGDTLKNIAQNRNISVDTIKWANNLTSDNIQPGWFLVLPSTDGVLVQTDENTSISEIASKFHGDPERILSFNGLANPDAFEPGQYLMCPGCSIPKATTSTAERKIGFRSKDIPDEAGSTHTFYPGHCTWYVAKKFKVTFGGSARYWIQNAKAAKAYAFGAAITSSPL
jgi:LysM repeat protein